MEEKNTPLVNEHVKLGAAMGSFSEWNMPIHYGSILDEAKHTRSNVSIFDVSHMGELYITEEPGTSSLDQIITVPVTKMNVYSCGYGFLLNDNGTIIDDLIVYRIKENQWKIVVNASNNLRDADIIKSKLSQNAEFENRSDKIVKIDIQGPKSEEALKKMIGSEIAKLRYYKFGLFKIFNSNEKYIISRTGYTGESGFEIYIKSDRGVELWRELLKFKDVKPAGLGARDILRLEMGYPLYGHELTENTTPIEAGMKRFLDMGKEFIGKSELIKKDKEEQSKKLVGFVVEGRRTPRHGNKILVNEVEIGFVTSGVFSPHLNCGIGLGYMDTAGARLGTDIFIHTEKVNFNAKINKTPFIKRALSR